MAFFDDYPYTNWHNVNLDWVLERVKEWGQQVDNLQLSFDNLEAANESFKTYVENYLQDLDVYSEISRKIDELLESGELVTYLQPYISSTVTTWLDENITEPVGVVIDSSLSVAGAAADAKAVGDELNILKVHNTWEWVLNDNTILLHGGLNPQQSDAPSRLVLTAADSQWANTRRTLAVTKGKCPIYQAVSGGSPVQTIYYPIPIPRTARHMKISMLPYGMQIYVHTLPYNVENDSYDNSVVSNRIEWTSLTNGSIEEDLTQVEDRQLFLVANFRYNASGIVFPVEPQEIIVKFS